MAKSKGGWFGESFRHAQAARGVRSGRKSKADRSNPRYASSSAKKPKMVSVEEAEKWGRIENVHIVLPVESDSYEGIARELNKKYGLDLDTDEESDYYENLFYGADLRSICGTLWEVDEGTVSLIMQPRYWAGNWGEGEFTLDTMSYGNNWRKMLADAESVVDANKM